MTLSPYLHILLGLTLLFAGGDLLVRGASRLARALGVSPLMVGLTVVAFGTSAPEAAVSVQASLAGNPGLALGNVVGSNVFNVLLILGMVSLIAPLPVQRQLIRLDVPVMIAASLLVCVLALDGTVGVAEGAVLISGLVGYLGYLVQQGRRAPGSVPEESDPVPPAGARARGTKSLIMDLVLIALGLGALVWGADQLVEGSVAIARRFGASELVIGLTLVAAGTSLPEVAASVVAAVRGEREIAVGNVVGSNIFNLLFVLGASALAGEGGVPVPQGALTFDLPVMAGVALACFPVFLTGRVISRWEGALFLLYYAIYLVLLLVDASGHDARDLLWNAMLEFVIPLTAVTALLGWWRGEMDRRTLGHR